MDSIPGLAVLEACAVVEAEGAGEEEAEDAGVAVVVVVVLAVEEAEDVNSCTPLLWLSRLVESLSLLCGLE